MADGNSQKPRVTLLNMYTQFSFGVPFHASETILEIYGDEHGIGETQTCVAIIKYENMALSRRLMFIVF